MGCKEVAVRVSSRVRYNCNVYKTLSQFHVKERFGGDAVQRQAKAQEGTLIII